MEQDSTVGKGGKEDRQRARRLAPIHVIGQRRVDEQEAYELISSFICAACFLVGDLGRKDPGYRLLRSNVWQLIEETVREEIAGVEETATALTHLVRTIPRSERYAIEEAWENISSKLSPEAEALPEVRRLSAAITALRIAPDNLGKVQA